MHVRRTVAFVSLLTLALVLPSRAQWNPPNPVLTAERQDNAANIRLKFGMLRIEVNSPVLLHVTYSLAGSSRPPRPSDHVLVKTTWPAADFTLSSDAKAVTLATSALEVAVDRDTGAIHYRTPDGKTLTTDSNRTLRPAEVNGEQTFHAEVDFAIYGSHEGFYGLGQHQAGVWNYRGEEVDLSQENTEIAIPFFLSTNGYGIFWNNPSRSRFNNRFVHSLYLTAEVADRTDYYFLYGPSADQLVGLYRDLTGQVPLFGRWAYGFWQCKNKYQSQQEIEAVAAKYRALHIPVDNIVQDWFWWANMGEMQWNQKYPDPQAMIDTLHQEHFHLMVSVWPFLNPGTLTYDEYDRKGWLVAKTVLGGFHPAGHAVYDATDPAARKQFWASVNTGLFARGVDAWWLDTDEPETEGRADNIVADHHLAIGSGARYANVYPLFHTEGISQGQQGASDQKRVFILSRSVYAGAQRLGVTAWSGDVLSDWLSFQRQIPAGLNYALSGMPYWTTDIGGFISGGNLADPNFRELFVRWFQFGAFSPVFRVHGTRSPDENELWSYGPDAQKILVDYDNLRYRLLPYIYSQAWQITANHSTLMRPLVMDWREDVNAQNTSDEYLFGPAFLVSPVTTPGAITRPVYLPQSIWYDFWTGDKLDAPQRGTRITADAPLAKLPLYVRAGSIVPFGPTMEWSTEKPADPIELRIYPGADGDFTLYEDENDNYNYTRGTHATIALHWNDAAKTLTLGPREGAFPGMLATRTFKVVVVGKEHGIGIAETLQPNTTVSYKGDKLEVKP